MFGDAVRRLAQGFRHLLYPGECLACTALLPPDGDHFCAPCAQALADDPHATCPRCAGSVGPHADTTRGCPGCRDSRLHFERAFRLGPYEGALRELILRMKYNNELLAEALGGLFAAALAPRLLEWKIDVVVPVPLHWWRRLRRRYNQTEPLAEALAAQLGADCRPRGLRRIRATPKQTTLTPAGRRANVLGAFRAGRRARFAGQTILLVDDVLTTGATASEAARALRQAGAARVIVAILGHG